MDQDRISNIDISFMVVWLDENIDKTKVSRDTKASIRHAAHGQLITFTDPDLCVDYILSETGKRIFLIISNAFGWYLTELIYQIRQIQRIYVFCINRQRAEEWAKPEYRITGIFTDRNTLIKKICEDISACSRDSHLQMSIFHLEDKQHSLQDLSSDTAKFMWFELLMIVLQRLPPSDISKDEMITECRLIYHSDPVEQKKINTFQREYNRNKAIWWYTNDCFVYRLLNKALRTQDIDIIFKFRFFISDLQQQLAELYSKLLESRKHSQNHSMSVYRGQHLSIEEINVLKANIDGLISMNTFLSATTNFNIALIFAETDPTTKETSKIQSTLLIINIKDMCKTTSPFVPIKEHSCCQDEDEVLFTINCVFQIKQVEKQNDTWHVHLELTKSQDKFYSELSKHIISQIGSETSLFTLGWFLYRMNKFTKAENFVQKLIKQLPHNNKTELAYAYNLLGLIYKGIGQLKSSIDSYEKALELCSSTDDANGSPTISIHYNLGLAYLALGENELAQKHVDCTNRLVNTASMQHPIYFALRDSLQGKIDAAGGKYHRALTNLQRSLSQKKLELPEGHASIASTLKDIGVVHAKLQNYDQALEYLTQAENILKKGLENSNLDLADCHTNIGKVYYQCKEYQLALERFQIALHMFQDNIRSEDTTINDLEDCISKTTAKLQSRSNSL